MHKDFWGSFKPILELLLEEYYSERCRERKGYPYPLAKDFCYHRDATTGKLIPSKPLWKLTNKFLRDHAVIAAGDSGWRNYSFKGLLCTPAEQEFFRTFQERGIEAYFVPESLTTAVSIT